LGDEAGYRKKGLAKGAVRVSLAERDIGQISKKAATIKKTAAPLGSIAQQTRKRLVNSRFQQIHRDAKGEIVAAATDCRAEGPSAIRGERTRGRAKTISKRTKRKSNHKQQADENSSTRRSPISNWGRRRAPQNADWENREIGDKQNVVRNQRGSKSPGSVKKQKDGRQRT